jgi:hypothetical protein
LTLAAGAGVAASRRAFAPPAGQPAAAVTRRTSVEQLTPPAWPSSGGWCYG